MDIPSWTKFAVRPWTDLRGISNSSAAKSTILIPLVGYLIVFNQNVLPWLQLARQLGGGVTQDHISPRILWLYIALCAIALGTLIYAWRCPPEVKKYGDYKDYANGDGPAMTSRTLDEIQTLLDNTGYDAFGKPESNDVLNVYFDYLNSLHPVSRLGAVRNAVGIRCGAFSGNMKVSFQAARSIG